MRRIVSTFFFGCIIGTAFGIAVGLFAFPYVFPPPVAKEQVTARERASGIVARGQFIHVKPSDPVHYGTGKDSVYRKLVHLEADFEVGPGPAYHVYLSSKANIRASSDFSAAGSLDLGRLRSFKGSQKYDIPPEADLAKYRSVVIWCQQFGVLISPADLRPEA